MMTRYKHISLAALLTVILLLTAAGCAAGKPASGTLGQLSAEKGAIPARLNKEKMPFLTNPGDQGNGTKGAELVLEGGSPIIRLVEGTAIEEGMEPVFTVFLTELEFVDGEGFSEAGFVWENFPDGLNFAVERLDGTQAKITISGTPTKAMEKADLSLYISKELFTEDIEQDRITAKATVSFIVQPSQSTVSDAQSAKLIGDSISLTAGEAIQEGEEPVLTVTLTGLEFVDDELFSESGFAWEKLPKDLDFSVKRVDGTTAKITLSGTPAEAAENFVLRLTIEKEQFQSPPEKDVSVDGSVAMEIAAGSGIPVSPVVLAVCGAAVVILIVVTILSVRVSKKKKLADKRQAPPVAKIAKTENVRRNSERRDMPNQPNIQNIAPTAPVAPRQNARTDVPKSSGTVQIGKLHNIGRRSAQQDSLGSMNLDGGGVFAVVADGMGGLSGGDQVSQGVVMSMLQQAGSLGPGQMDGELNAMVRSANEEINRQLGPNGIYRSGSTVVAVLLRGNAFHWISVGDSRIYLYRGGSMIQLNQEHTYAVELMQRVMNGEITAAEAANDPQRRGLTSFIGMGRLKYMDVSMRPIVLQSGDRILLMTDGVFNNLPESAMADTIRRNPDVQQAAKVLEEQVLALQDPAQDNFTAIILGFQG